MFRCDMCNVVVTPGTPSHTVVVETRPTEYPSRAKAHRMRVGRKLKTLDDPGGAGYEIAKEARVCGSCAEDHAAKQRALDEAEMGGTVYSA